MIGQLLAIMVALAAVLTPSAEATAGNPLYGVLGPADRELAAATVQDALETLVSGQRLNWRGTTTGTSGYVVPQRTFRIESGHYCREYQEAVLTPGQVEIRLLTACRSREDGRWITVDPQG